MKMKTREIDVWVNKHNVMSGDFRNVDIYTDLDKYNREWSGSPLKAKLVIELPEKKIEIAESEFDEVWGWLFK